MSKAPTIVYNVPMPSLEYPGRPVTTAKQNYALQAEFFLCKAVERAAWAYRDQYEQVIGFMNILQNEIATEGLATGAGQDELRALIFENTFHRDFVRTVQLNFFAMHSEWHQAWKEFLTNISFGLTFTPISNDIESALQDVPDELMERTYTANQVRLWLEANTWACTVILLKMWGTIPDGRA